jgi:hypothetical protein
VDPNDPYKTDIPGQKYRINQDYNRGSWFKYTFQPVRDALDLDAYNRWGSPYSGGALFAMADASVRSVSYSTSIPVMVAAVTPNGGETLPLD